MATAETARPAETAPRVVIEPRPGWLAINWADLWRYRELLYFLTWRDIVIRYKQTVLGVAWAVLQPLIKMLVFTLIFKGVAGLEFKGAGRVPYQVFVFAGLLPWQFFEEAMRRGGESVVRNANIVGKVYFPRLLIPMAAVGSALVDFALCLIVLAGIMAWYGVAPGVEALMVVPLALLTTLAALGISTALSALMTAYRDFRYVVPFLLTTWMFLTPVAWPFENVLKYGRGAQLALAANPLCGIVEGYRAALIPGREMDWAVLGISAGVSVVMLVVGLYVFRRIERQFADII